MSIANEVLLQALASRRSIKAKHLCTPAPSLQELSKLVQTAMRVPDHNLSIPYRFVVVEEKDRDKLARLYEQAPELAPGSPFDAGQWLAGHSRAYITTCYPFHPSPTSLYAALFRPVEAIERLVRTYTERFSAHTVGIHIRRTDNAMSIAHSPLSLFIQAMERELEAHPDTTFFVASDSEADKHTLRTHFGPRILTSSAPADRNSKAGMQQGAVDLFTLSRTDKIFGSCYSSFSEVAAMLRSIPYHRIQQGL